MTLLEVGELVRRFTASPLKNGTFTPHKGPQSDYFSTDADIIIYGGAAGGGKTWCLLVDPTQHINIPGFYGVILRRDSEQIRQAGGLWDESLGIYPEVGGKGREHTLDWSFGSGARIRFDAMLRENDKLSYQGAQLAYIGFDELTHFTASQFWYLQSRNRTVCGIKPYTRATCNPDPNSWVKELLGPWVDSEFTQGGEEFKAESGEVLWIIREQDDSITYYRDKPDDDAISLTFIQAMLDDNPTLTEKDPDYRRKLEQLPMVDRMRLLGANWDIMEGGNVFKPEWFETVDEIPECVSWVRFWDMAATKPKPGKTDPDFTAGVKMGKTRFGRYVVADVKTIRDTPGKVEELIARTAEEDGEDVVIRMEQEGGSSGKTVIDQYRRYILSAYDFDGDAVSINKQERAKPYAGQAEAGNVMLLKAPWNKKYLNELAAFPNPDVHDDQVDGSSGAYKYLAKKQVRVRTLSRKGSGYV